MTEDMGLTPDEQAKISKSYTANMKVIYDEMLKRGKFTWQQVGCFFFVSFDSLNTHTHTHIHIDVEWTGRLQC
jgi:hypothetical protein